MEDTIFGRKTLKAAPKIFKSNRPQLKNIRKERSDKKYDIKFKLSINDKKLLKLKALEHQLSLTAYCSQIVKKDLILNRDYDNYVYDNDGIFVHASLERDYFEMLKTIAAEWNLSYRKAVHRIIKEYLNHEFNGITIEYYNDTR
ncbi:MAG TPA: hypothetical protein GXX18_06330 [Bacillales bacterium]|nr:hypothetical protein [Bacillales bacterium]